MAFTIYDYLSDQYAKLEFTPVDLAGKVIIVTGANTGIGYGTVQHLVKMGPARLIMACRNMNKANEAIESLKKDTVVPEGVIIEAMELDISSFESCQSFVKKYQERDLPLHILINNAGIGGLDPFTLTKDGHETMFATNHLGTSLLTLLLLPVLRKTARSNDSTFPRIVILSSEMHHMTWFKERDAESIVKAMDDPKGDMNSRYPNTKLMNLLFTQSLAKHLQASKNHPEDRKITVHAVNPGYVNSEIGAKRLSWIVSRIYDVLKVFLGLLIARTIQEGSKTSVLVATSPECGIETGAPNGQYYSSCKVAKTSILIDGQVGVDLAEKLWLETLATLPLDQVDLDL
eukprot:gene9775-11414_t